MDFCSKEFLAFLVYRTPDRAVLGLHSYNLQKLHFGPEASVGEASAY